MKKHNKLIIKNKKASKSKKNLYNKLNLLRILMILFILNLFSLKKRMKLNPEKMPSKNLILANSKRKVNSKNQIQILYLNL
jgi:hypothetical protein